MIALHTKTTIWRMWTYNSFQFMQRFECWVLIHISNFTIIWTMACISPKEKSCTRKVIFFLSFPSMVKFFLLHLLFRFAVCIFYATINEHTMHNSPELESNKKTASRYKDIVCQFCLQNSVHFALFVKMSLQQCTSFHLTASNFAQKKQRLQQSRHPNECGKGKEKENKQKKLKPVDVQRKKNDFIKSHEIKQ